MRPNPEFFRDTVFNFLQIQVGRRLSTHEVHEVNYVMKQRARRYIAASEREWLFPERYINSEQWDRLGGGYLFMPDPRSVTFHSGIMMGFSDGHRDALDPYGRRPGDAGYRTEPDEEEWMSFLAFQGEYARVFGPKLRGRAFEYGRAENEVDSEQLHTAYLRQESRNKPRNPKTRRYAKDLRQE